MIEFLEGTSLKFGGPNKIEMKTRSVGGSITEVTLFRVSGCLAVPNESPAENFLFPYRTEPPTR